MILRLRQFVRSPFCANAEAHNFIKLNPSVIYSTYNNVTCFSYDFFIIISFDEAIPFTGYEPKYRNSFSHLSFLIPLSLSSMEYSYDPYSLIVLRLTWIKLSFPHLFHLSSIHLICASFNCIESYGIIKIIVFADAKLTTFEVSLLIHYLLKYHLPIHFLFEVSHSHQFILKYHLLINLYWSITFSSIYIEVSPSHQFILKYLSKYHLLIHFLLKYHLLINFRSKYHLLIHFLLKYQLLIHFLSKCHLLIHFLSSF
jgi:hypothetical protein